MLDFPGGPMVENLLAIRETQVQSLLWEDPTCRGAAKPGCQDCWASALEPESYSYLALPPGACIPRQERSLQREAHVLQLAPIFLN